MTWESKNVANRNNDNNNKCAIRFDESTRVNQSLIFLVQSHASEWTLFIWGEAKGGPGLFVWPADTFFFLSVAGRFFNKCTKKSDESTGEIATLLYTRDVNGDTIPPLHYTPKTFTGVWLCRRRWSPPLFDCHQENGHGNTRCLGQQKGGKRRCFA